MLLGGRIDRGPKTAALDGSAKKDQGNHEKNHIYLVTYSLTAIRPEAGILSDSATGSH